MFPKSKRKTKTVTWRDYRFLIGLIFVCLGIVQFILSFDPIIINIDTPYEAQFEFAIFTTLISLWMPLAYWFGRKKGFSRQWMFICIGASLLAMLMLTLEQHHRSFPPACVYEPLGTPFLWIRTQLGGCIDWSGSLF